MPSTPKQQRAAGAELRLRRSGEVKQEAKGRLSTRPFGGMSETNLSKFAQGIDKEITKLRGRLKDTGSTVHRQRLSRAIEQKARQDRG